MNEILALPGYLNFSWTPIHLNCRRVSIHLDLLQTSNFYPHDVSTNRVFSFVSPIFSAKDNEDRYTITATSRRKMSLVCIGPHVNVYQ